MIQATTIMEHSESMMFKLMGPSPQSTMVETAAPQFMGSIYFLLPVWWLATPRRNGVGGRRGLTAPSRNGIGGRRDVPVLMAIWRRIEWRRIAMPVECTMLRVRWLRCERRRRELLWEHGRTGQVGGLQKASHRERVRMTMVSKTGFTVLREKAWLQNRGNMRPTLFRRLHVYCV